MSNENLALDLRADAAAVAARALAQSEQPQLRVLASDEAGAAANDVNQLRRRRATRAIHWSDGGFRLFRVR